MIMNKQSFSTEFTLVYSDTHFLSAGNEKLFVPQDCHNPRVLSLPIQVAQNHHPDNIIHIGDVSDMKTVSHWRENTHAEALIEGDDDKLHETCWQEQMQMVIDFWTYQHDTYPKAKLFQLEGNHDYWCENAYNAKPIIRHLMGTKWRFRSLPIWKHMGGFVELKPYDGDQKKDQPWIDIGGERGVRVLHGYNKGTPARILKYCDNAMYGHTHKIIYTSNDGAKNEYRRVWSIGCLSELHPKYASLGGNQSEYVHGFGVIYVLPNGEFEHSAVSIKNESLVNFEGKTYYPKPLSKLSPILKSLEQ